jgi:hypothetical protein
VPTDLQAATAGNAAAGAVDDGQVRSRCQCRLGRLPPAGLCHVLLPTSAAPHASELQLEHCHLWRRGLVVGGIFRVGGETRLCWAGCLVSEAGLKRLWKYAGLLYKPDIK